MATSKALFVSRFAKRGARGHFLYLYRAINSFEPGSVLAGAAAPEGVGKSVFSNLVGGSRFKTWVSLFDLFLLDTERLHRALTNSRASHIVFYDGDLSDFWLSLRLASRHPSKILVFNLHRAHIWLARLSDPSFVARFRHALRAGPKNIVLTAESAELAKLASAKFGTDVEPWPICSNISNLELSRPDREENLFDVLLVVNGRPPKGWVDAFCKAIEGQGFDTRRLVAIDAHESSWPTRSKTQSREQYLGLCKSVRITVLAYFEPFYKLGSSGRLEDALCLGSHVIVPPWTAMAVRSCNSETFGSELRDFEPLATAQLAGRLALGPGCEHECRTAEYLLQEICRLNVDPACEMLAPGPSRYLLLELWWQDARVRSILRASLAFLLPI